MGDIVNLNRARKARQKAERTREAERNRVLHGRAKAEKTRHDEERARAARELDGHRRDESE